MMLEMVRVLRKLLKRSTGARLVCWLVIWSLVLEKKYCSLFPIILRRTIVPGLLLEMVGRMIQRIHGYYTFFSPYILLSFFNSPKCLSLDIVFLQYLRNLVR